MVARKRVVDEDSSNPAAADGLHAAQVRHPFDPLEAGEIARAVEILRRERPVTPEARFVSVTLNEPRKDQIVFVAPAVRSAGGRSIHPGHFTPPAAAVPREVFVVLLEPQQHTTYEAVVSLTTGSVLSWRPVPGARAPMTLAEYAQCELVTRADSRVRSGLERRNTAIAGRKPVNFDQGWRLLTTGHHI